MATDGREASEQSAKQQVPPDPLPDTETLSASRELQAHVLLATRPAPRQQDLREAVTGLERIYAVLSGFALTNGLKNIATEWLDSGKPFPVDHLLLFVGLVATLIPFSHGAWQHLTVFHLNPKSSRSTAGVFLFDYFMLLAEGLLFVLLAFATVNLEKYLWLLLILILTDVIFVAGTILELVKRDAPYRTAVQWGLLDLGTLLVGFIVWKSLRSASVVASLLILRTLIDYRWNWSFYFPTESEATSAK